MQFMWVVHRPFSTRSRSSVSRNPHAANTTPKRTVAVAIDAKCQSKIYPLAADNERG